jgi:hypothetical protein
MLQINDPQDILGIAVRNLLEFRASRGELESLVVNWEKTIVIEVVGMYAVSMHFQKNEIRIEPGSVAKFDLKLAMSINNMLAIADGEIGLIRLFLTGQVKLKKMWHLATLLRFLKIIIPALKIAGERGAHFRKTHRS